MTETEIKITKLTASDGMVLTNGDVYGKEIYLGKYDSPENWREITNEEAANMQVPLEKEE